MRKRDMAVEIDRLRGELSYLRGRVAELEKAPGEAIGHVKDLVVETLRVSFPAPQPQSQFFDVPTPDPGMDWTDQLSPRVLTDEQYREMEYDLNDRLEIADELDRD